MVVATTMKHLTMTPHTATQAEIIVTVRKMLRVTIMVTVATPSP
jgi:hypothetical protein